jgi:hypothetical protein
VRGKPGAHGTPADPAKATAISRRCRRSRGRRATKVDAVKVPTDVAYAVEGLLDPGPLGPALAEQVLLHDDLARHAQGQEEHGHHHAGPVLPGRAVHEDRGARRLGDGGRHRVQPPPHGPVRRVVLLVLVGDRDVPVRGLEGLAILAHPEVDDGAGVPDLGGVAHRVELAAAQEPPPRQVGAPRDQLHPLAHVAKVRARRVVQGHGYLYPYAAPSGTCRQGPGVVGVEPLMRNGTIVSPAHLRSTESTKSGPPLCTMQEPPGGQPKMR